MIGGRLPAVCAVLLPLGGCGLADVGVQRVRLELDRPEALGRYFTRGEDLVCAYDPGQPSPVFLEPLGPGARQAELDLQRTCPKLRTGDIPRALLKTEQSVFFGLRSCRVTRIYKFVTESAYAVQAEPYGFCAPPDRLRAHPRGSGYPRITGEG
jgi:hypothetical protein